MANGNKKDSLIQIVQSNQQDTNQVKALNQLGLTYEFEKIDTATALVSKALNISKRINYYEGQINAYIYLGWFKEDISKLDSAILFYKKALKLAEQTKNKNKKAKALNSLGIASQKLGLFDQATSYYKQTIAIQKNINDSVGLSKTYQNLGLVYQKQVMLADALDYLYKSLKIKHSLNDSKGVANTLNAIGNIYYIQSNLQKALELYQESFKIRKSIDDKKGLCESHMSIGNIYLDEKDYENALNYFKQGLAYAIEMKDPVKAAGFYNNIGTVYSTQEKYKKALEFFKKGADLKKMIGDIEGMAKAYNNLGLLYVKVGDYQKSIKYSKIGIDAAKKLNSPQYYLNAYNSLAVAYDSLGRTKDALKNYRIYMQYKDTLIKRATDERLSDLQTKYETAEKEQKIEILTKNAKLQKLAMEKKNAQTKFLIVGLLFAFILVGLIFRNNIVRKKANKLLSDQNSKITKQKEIIEKIHQEVSESIDYAKRIQTAILPDVDILNKAFSASFVFFQPKEKVSGDFYWWTTVENQTIVTAVDCTGHGVPGAFMSMLGVSSLREIVIKEYIFQPALILKNLRRDIIHILKQKGETGEQKDGMDMALISYNSETKILQYAGANNPLYLITKSELQILNNNNKAIKFYDNSKLLYEIKPDKMPIAIYDKMDNFTNYEIQLQEGDQVYLFSDGFADQFGGSKGKKFKYKPFKKLLLENADKPMVEQKNILNQTINKWMANEEQIDDIVVLGLKV